MTTTTPSYRAAGRGYGFRTVARMEWHKLRTIRSTWLIGIRTSLPVNR